MLGFNGTVNVPYPEGFQFPQPDLRSTFTVGPNSALDPYLYFEAMDGIAPDCARSVRRTSYNRAASTPKATCSRRAISSTSRFRATASSA